MTTLTIRSAGGRGGGTTRRKQVLRYAFVLILLLALASIQNHSPTKRLAKLGFSSSSTFQTIKQQSTSNTNGNDGQTPPTKNLFATDPSSIPFDKDYLPKAINEKWRNRHSTGVRMGVHKLKQVPKEIFSEIEQDASNNITTIQQGSTTTTTIHYHAIVVPYRNREYHLQEFQKRLYPYIEKHFRHPSKEGGQQHQRQHVSEFSLWIVEQDDEEPFNRGWLGNVGIAEILRHTPEVECLTFHDVDFVPETVEENPAVLGTVYYDRCAVPTQTGSELFRTGLNWTVGYQEHAGGVVTMHLQHWQAVNGFSNDYVSWGGEDDDLYLRLRDKGLLSVSRQRKFLMRRPPLGFGRFHTVSDAKEHHVQDAEKGKNPNYQVSLQILEQVREGYARVDRSDYDGLSDLQYKVNSHKVRRTGPSSSPTLFGFQMAHHLKVKQQLLEWIPIPGTGIEWIETAASRLGIPWGRCHFQQDEEDDDYDHSSGSNGIHGKETKSQCVTTPDFANLGLTRTGQGSLAEELWHVPPHHWNINMFLGKHTFVVVRNPYELVISRYLEQNTTTSTGGNQSDPLNEKQTLNEFVESKLCRSTDPLTSNAEPIGWLSQYAYVFVNGTQIANHVLRYENLTSELASLMEQYDLPLDLHSHEKPTDGEGAPSWSIQNLTNRSIGLIQLHYARDFAEFGYSHLLQDVDRNGPSLCAPSQS